jgi:phosphoribosylformylglycinamidine cyclo-ligase
VFFEQMWMSPQDRPPELGGATIGDALLAPHISYLRPLWPLLEEDLVHAMAHITGGGFYENIPRVLPSGVGVKIQAGAWPVPPVFDAIARHGQVSFEEMHRVFNMGIGMVLFVGPADVARVSEMLLASGQRHFFIGSVVLGDRRVIVEADKRDDLEPPAGTSPKPD